MPADRLQGVLDAAQMLVGKGKKSEAFAKYKEVLDADPAHPEALAWVEDYLRTKRDYSQLRDVLLASVRHMGSVSDASVSGRKDRLREVSGLCARGTCVRHRRRHRRLGSCSSRLDRAGTEAARAALTRLLEKSQRWDDLASLLEQEATAEHDPEMKITLEKKLANLQETKRKDFVAAGEAWSRIAQLTPDDAQAARRTASRCKALRERGPDRSRRARARRSAPPCSRSPRSPRGTSSSASPSSVSELNDLPGAGDSYAADAADALKSQKLWESAERCFSTAERWDRAANAALAARPPRWRPEGPSAAPARAADLCLKSGDRDAALQRLEQANDLDPLADEYATMLVDRYTADESWQKLVLHLAKRGDRLTDRSRRVHLRTQAATLYATKLGDQAKAPASSGSKCSRTGTIARRSRN